MRFQRLLLTGLITGWAACASPLEPLDLDGSLTVNPATARVNQEVTVVLEAEGTRLLGLRIDYGDGTEPEFLGVAGARTARWTRTHAFAQAGTYTVRGRIEESSDTLSRTATVTVTAAASSTMPSPRIFARRSSNR